MNTIITKNDKMYFHPGYYLSEILEEIPLEEVSKTTGIETDRLVSISRGEVNIDRNLAEKLEKLGASSTFWMSVQWSFNRILSEEEMEI